jgi:hypothetical protein
VFASITNAGAQAARACGIGLLSSVDVDFRFQATEPGSNAPAGSPGEAIDIPAGGTATFVITVRPRSAFAPRVLRFAFRCSNSTEAPYIPGLNTLTLSATDTPTADVIALGLTASGDGVVRIPAASRVAAFGVASINVGAAQRLTVTVQPSSHAFALVTAICRTNPATARCVEPSVPVTDGVTLDIGALATPTFAVFVAASDHVAADPANHRLFVRFTDAAGVLRGATSVAVQTE